jgi:hypothetical protein
MNGVITVSKWLFQQYYYNRVGFVLLLCLLCLFSCKEEEEGCTDITATNWEADKDKSCEDCCTYPKLNLIVEHAYGDTTLFKLREPYTDDSGNVYKVLSIRYYISDFALKANGQDYRVSDSIRVSVVVGDTSSFKKIRNDIILVSSGKTNYPVGTLRPNGEWFDSLSLYIGVAPPFDQVLPASVPNNHPLAPMADSMYWDQQRGYIFQRLLVIPDTMLRDTMLLEIGGADVLKAITLPYGKIAKPGLNVDIRLKVDYQIWFKGINFATDTPEIIKEKIVSNIAESFSIKP